MINVGDIVCRKSYNCDVIFEVVEITDNIAILIGKTVRLVADAELEDLELVDAEDLEREEKKEDEVIEDISSQGITNNRKKYLTGKILHIDGDSNYMRKCLNLYKKVGVYAIGVETKEKDIPKNILKYVKHFRPDVIVITGHDSYNKRNKDDVNNYRNSKYFVEGIKVIREHYPVINQPIIIGGACQSHFEALIASGANFASSPSRVNIKSLDPAIIAIKCCATSVTDLVKVNEAVHRTSHKNEGMGGIESFGTMKTLYY